MKNKLIIGVAIAVCAIIGWHFTAQSIAKSKIETAFKEHQLDRFISYRDMSVNSFTLDATLEKVTLNITLPQVFRKAVVINLEADAIVLRDFNNDDDELKLDASLNGLKFDFNSPTHMALLQSLDWVAKPLLDLAYQELTLDTEIVFSLDKTGGESSLAITLKDENKATVFHQLTGEQWQSLPLLVEGNPLQNMHKLGQIAFTSVQVSVEDHGLFARSYDLYSKSIVITPDDVPSREQLKFTHDFEKAQKEGERDGINIDVAEIGEAYADFIDDPDTFGLSISADEPVVVIDIFNLFAGRPNGQEIIKLINQLDVEVIQ
ncbi:hypothetical protein [Motilimonas eburnea]|uniref:hypothetical protein n=1 Tax=Motilimonas eburnea TaxID=1737488 RepID=UPI001E48520E|nr:hypothetical protein [Motilimonas eburnea]MCE2571141.1 hypothetical protein [Motilimonas eburnea]